MRSKHPKQKQGVALIMAVGFLAVLILMAIGFAVSMRVERLAARNFSDVVATRQHARTGLTRALTELNGRLATDPLLTAGTQRGIFWQAGGPTGSAENLLSGWASNYIPPQLARRVEQTDPAWFDIKDKYNKTIGRYQYVVVDCSGLIDVNFDHGTNLFLGAARTVMTNALDIRMESTWIPEVAGGDFLRLKNGRNDASALMPSSVSYPWYRMESMAEVWRYLGRDTYGLAVFDRPPTNFFVYSRFPPGYEITPNTGQITQALPIAWSQAEWDFATTQAGLQQTTGIVARLRDRFQTAYLNSGLSAALSAEYAENLARSVGDYCDSDNVPCTIGPTNSCTEATPLINEIVFEAEFTQVGQDVTVSAYPRIEVVYPFGGLVTSAAYTVRLFCQFVGASPAGLNHTAPFDVGSYTFTPNGGLWKWTGPDGMFQVSSPEGAADQFPKITRTVTLPASTSANIANMKCLVVAMLYETATKPPPASAPRVDAVGFGNPPTLSVDLNFMPLNGGKKSGGKACNDPRHNAYITQWARVGEGAALPTTLNAFNTGVATWNSGSGEGVKWMYVANRRLQSAGEIGLLGIGLQWPWRTVDLLDNSGGPSPYVLPVLDIFTMTTNLVTRHGLINLNTLQPNVLACAFNGVSPQPYPGAGGDGNSSAPAQVDPSTALDMATAYTTSRGGTLARRVSDVRVMGQSSTWGTGWSSADREAAVRNAANVLGTRDSVYTVLVNAQALSEETAEPISEQRALAVVWRDRVPRRDASGQLYNPTFVRSFRWMTD